MCTTTKRAAAADPPEGRAEQLASLRRSELDADERVLFEARREVEARVLRVPGSVLGVVGVVVRELPAQRQHAV